MKTIITSLAIIASISVTAQTRTAQVEYTETHKMEIDLPEGIDLSGMLPESISTNKVLIFKGQESVYINSNKQEEQDIEMESDDGSFKMEIMQDDSEDILYHNLTDKSTVHQTGLMGKSFVIDGEIPSIKWKIESDKISYLGYECTKATAKNSKGENIIAWYTQQIPVQCGPSFYNGLPGLILIISVNDGKREIKATALQTDQVNTASIKEPTDGKKVTAEEFEQIQKEKEAEMKQKYGSNSFIISN